MRKISSDFTFLHKYGVLLLLLVWLSGMIVALVTNIEHIWWVSVLLTVALPAIIYEAYICLRLCDWVELDDANLYFRRWKKSAIVALTEIKDVEQVSRRPRTIRVTLKSPSALGEKLTFIPALDPELIYKVHPLVGELSRLSQKK